ncbi:WD domain G-beta repeat [Carpediemonas membranifera]|uniref:WD domain G-beta repeat n=1 Tax=Carpediemonas membranifera TaxID=201153 RepID=A0A8J6E228_9EUKA|nr:WD domain G-beta repeat [Carpediemonas membranifera]|eukprot:KAG9397104.1 WD domain G-beta repeat [Carpediemonas membranifera]
MSDSQVQIEFDLTNVSTDIDETQNIQIPISTSTEEFNDYAKAILELDEVPTFAYMVSSFEYPLTGSIGELINHHSHLSAEDTLLVKAVVALPAPEDGKTTPTDQWIQNLVVHDNKVFAGLINGDVAQHTVNANTLAITPARTINMAEAPLRGLAVSGDRLMTGARDKSLHMATLKSAATSVPLPECPTAAVFLSKTLAVVGTESGKLYTVDIKSDEATPTLFPVEDTEHHQQTVTALAYNYPFVFSASHDGTIRQWHVNDLATPRTVAPVRTMRSSSAVWAMDARQVSPQLVTGQADGSVRVWTVPDDVNAAVHSAKLPGHRGPAAGVAFLWSSGQPFIVSGGFDCKLRYWDLRNHDAPVHELEVGHRVHCVAVAPHNESALVLAGGAEKTMWSWVVRRPEGL